MRQSFAALFFLPAVAMAAHPLVTDDAGTQGAGAWQLEVNADYARAPDQGFQQRVANTTLTVGAADTIDLFVNGTALRSESLDNSGMPTVARGAGDLSVGGKWRLFENDKLSLALKATANLPSGDSQRGLGNGMPYYAAAAIAGYQIGDWVLLANAAGAYFSGNVPDQQQWQWSLSVAAVRDINDTWQIVGELATYSSALAESGGNTGLLSLGLIYRMLPVLDLDIGYRYGLKDASMDHGFGAGLAFRW